MIYYDVGGVHVIFAERCVNSVCVCWPFQSLKSFMISNPTLESVHMGVSENSVPLHPMVLLIIIPIKWLFHWEYT